MLDYVGDGWLDISCASRLVKIERLSLGEDEPFAIETCYSSGDEFGNLTRAKLDRASLFSVLERIESINETSFRFEMDPARDLYFWKHEFGESIMVHRLNRLATTMFGRLVTDALKRSLDLRL